MNVMHEKVQHDKYGIGIVVGQTEAMIAVQFSRDYGIKKFLYPSAFEQFLVLCDLLVHEQMNAVLKQVRQQAESERKHKEEEAQKRQAEEKQRELDMKRASARKRLGKSGKEKNPKKPARAASADRGESKIIH